LLVVVLGWMAAIAEAAAVGDRLLRTFEVFSNMPLDLATAESLGWTTTTSSCSSGYVYVPPGGGISKSNSIFLVFSGAGQIGGFGVRVYGDSTMSSQLSPAFWVETGDQQYDLTVYTRDPSTLCSSTPQAETLGDRVLVAGTLDIPLTMSEAEAAGWYAGNCINKMGIHHSYDVASPGNMTWDASTLVPIMPMFDAVNGTINAVLFNVPDWQHTEPLGDWEGPFLVRLMCLNWCSSDPCAFPGVTTFSTMHWLFVDPATISCSGAACTLGEGMDDGMNM